MSIPVSAVTSQLGQWAMPSVHGGEWSLAGVGGGSPAEKAGAIDPTGGFGSTLSDAIGKLEQTQSAAADQARALATGETQDVTSVVTAVQEASLSMQLAAQVRNKAVEAYSEIFHTQV